MHTIEELTSKVESGKASTKEKDRLMSLVGFHREALAHAQTWLGERVGENLDAAMSRDMIPLLHGLSGKLSDHHMRLADRLAASSEDFEVPPESGLLDRKARLEFSAHQANSMVEGLEKFTLRNPEQKAAYDPIVRDLRAHAQTLTQRATETLTNDPLSVLFDATPRPQRNRINRTFRHCSSNGSRTARTSVPLLCL